MKIIKYIFLLPLLGSTFVNAQSETLDQSLSKYIPKNYSVLSIVKGDLDMDAFEDVIIVLNKNGEDTISTSKVAKRKFMLFVGQNDKTYKLIAENSNVVYHYDYDKNFKEAFVDVTIKKGEFSVNHYGGFALRWGRTTVFKYNGKDKKWYLITDEHSTFEASDQENTQKEKVYTSKNFGKVPFEKFDVYKLVK